MFERKQASGKESENYGGSTDEETSSWREAVMGNMRKACGTWLSAGLRKLGIFNDLFSCTQLETNQENIYYGYIHISICLYTYNHLP